MIEIKNVTMIFNQDMPKEDWRIALDDVSLNIEDGDFITVIGGNGSGKSTLLNLISKSFAPTSGDILFFGKNIKDMNTSEHSSLVGRVFQDPKMGTAGNMSIIENLELAIRRGEKRTLKWGFTKEHEEEFKNLLAPLNLNLETRLEQKVGVLSGGQRQALTLLMATLKKPSLLLLDEHTAALDPKTASKVLTLTNKIVTENKLTTLMITHNIKDALLYGNRLIMMYNGHIVMDVRGKEKEDLTMEDIYAKFDEMDQVLMA